MSYKQTQFEDVMSVFKKVPSSHHKLILRGKNIPTHNIDKCCSAESVYFPFTIILLSIKFKSGFHSFKVWHLIRLTKYFSSWENWCEGSWSNMIFCHMELRNRYFYSNFCIYRAVSFWGNNETTLIPYGMFSLFYKEKTANSCLCVL